MLKVMVMVGLADQVGVMVGLTVQVGLMLKV